MTLNNLNDVMIEFRKVNTEIQGLKKPISNEDPLEIIKTLELKVIDLERKLNAFMKLIPSTDLNLNNNAILGDLIFLENKVGGTINTRKIDLTTALDLIGILPEAFGGTQTTTPGAAGSIILKGPISDGIILLDRGKIVGYSNPT